MKRQVVYILLSIFCIQLSAQSGDEDKEMFNHAKDRDQKSIDEAVDGWWTASMKTHEQRIQWWREAKFGMFVHWGIYSLPGGEWKGKKPGGYAEHLMRKEKIARKEYLDLAHQFNPEKFNAEEWILYAKKAGMKYFVITAKHHDGFAIYDSKVSDFDIVDQTPFKKDPMAELAATAKKHGIKFGFYYSHAFDWEHPDAPGNDWEYNNPGGDKLIGSARWYDTHPEWLPKAVKYVDEKAIPQIKELLIKYHPDILWFDTPHKLPLSENIRILKAIRETDPNVVVNGRLARNSAVSFGDYKNTADRPAEFYPVSGDWEAIPTTNESYGYSKYDSSHKPVSHFIQLIASAASRGGNLLMNIGPKGDGSFDHKDVAILNGIGNWMEKNGESIYGTAAGPLPYHSWGVSTVKENKLYLHVFNWPEDGKLYVSGFTEISNGYLLAHPSKKIKIEQLPNGDNRLIVSKKAPDSSNTVLVFDYKRPSFPDSIHYITRNTMKERFLAFDAIQHGKGFSFGDGKTNRYYLDGWKKKDQSVSWQFRTESHTPLRFKMVIKYLATQETSGGSYAVIVDRNYSSRSDELYNSKHGVSTDARNVITQDLGDISLENGSYTLKLVPVTISKDELMKLLEVQLIPLDNK
ncbi:MAG TPA: alpha-L-fucosidase [Chitinophagaceae bacterium]|nr:alpha-L-fucosidase [Chitinophagaceae bacterium]